MRKMRVLISVIIMGMFFNLSAQETEPLQHVLLFKWKEEVTKEQKSEIYDLFEGLVTKVEGMQNVDIMPIEKSSGGFDVAIFIVFDDQASLKMYEQHPDHIKISKIAPPLIGGFGEFDFYGKLDQ